MSQFRRKLLESYATNKLVYPGLIAAWSAKGKTNEDADRNVLKDLTGNGHDITLNNFAYSGMSGYGGYNINFLTFGNTSSNLKEKTSTKIIVNGRVGGYIYYIYPKTEVPSFKIKISGLVTDYAYVDENNIRQVIRIKKGEHILPKSYASDTITTLCGFMNPITSESTENGIIELIPEYPDALVFDGVDDGGVAEINEPKLANSYTFIIEREIIKFNTFSCVALFQEGDDDFSPFGIEQLFNSTYYTWNYNSSTNINNIIKLEKSISYQTDKIYNNFIINKGSIPIRSKFNIGSWNNRCCVNMAFYSAYLFNRTLTDEEIKSFVRKHIDPEYLLLLMKK